MKRAMTIWKLGDDHEQGEPDEVEPRLEAATTTAANISGKWT